LCRGPAGVVEGRGTVSNVLSSEKASSREAVDDIKISKILHSDVILSIFSKPQAQEKLKTKLFHSFLQEPFCKFSTLYITPK
jgi:hypothetical protein